MQTAPGFFFYSTPCIFPLTLFFAFRGEKMEHYEQLAPSRQGSILIDNMCARRELNTKLVCDPNTGHLLRFWREPSLSPTTAEGLSLSESDGSNEDTLARVHESINQLVWSEVRRWKGVGQYQDEIHLIWRVQREKKKDFWGTSLCASWQDSISPFSNHEYFILEQTVQVGFCGQIDPYVI